MGKIVIPYKPRKAFQPYHDNTKRFSITVAHRRAGKTVARINKLIRKAVECDLPNPRFGYLAPYYVQAKDIAWLYLKHYSAPLIELGGKSNESELTITLPHNNAIIKLYGAENAERMRGLYFDGIVIDEGQGIAKSVLTTIILPALADRIGWLDVSGTPKGWENLLGELVKIARKSPIEWFLQILRASDTGIIPADELARQRALMPENEYEQEFECSFEAAITGSVYGAAIAKAEKDGRIMRVEHDPNLPVQTAMDLGRTNKTAIWWFQTVANELRILEYYEASGLDPVNIAEALYGRKIIIDERDLVTGRVTKFHFGEVTHQRRIAYKYSGHNIPHDGANKLLAAGGRSIYEQLTREYKLDHVRIVPAASEGDQQAAANATIPLCFFDRDGTERGLECLRHYQFEWDEDKKVFKTKPRHDWASDGADAFEIIGQVWRNPPEAKKSEPMKGSTQMTIDQMIAAQRRKRLNQE